MRGKHVRDDPVKDDIDDVTPATAVGAAHRRFGGFDLPAAFAGMLAALGLTVLLAGIAGAAGSIGYQRGATADDLSTSGLITGMVVLLLSFLVGGWVSGRMARYDGVLNGVSCGILFVILAAAVSGVGSWLDTKYDFFNNVRLPQWFSGPSTTAAVTTGVVGIVVVLLAAALGGAVGTRYHRRADALIATTLDDAVPSTSVPPREAMVRGDADVAVDRSVEARRAVR